VAAATRSPSAILFYAPHQPLKLDKNCLDVGITIPLNFLAILRIVEKSEAILHDDEYPQIRYHPVGAGG